MGPGWEEIQSVSTNLLIEDKLSGKVVKSFKNAKTFKKVAVKKLSDHFKGKIEICKNDKHKIK